MALPPLFQSPDVTDYKFLISEGLEEPTNQYREPGEWWNCERKTEKSACFPAVVQVIDIALAGTDPTTGEWRIDVVPITTQYGAAAADSMGPAFITIEANADTLIAVVQALIDESEDSANLLTLADADAWRRFRSYVRLTVSPTGTDVLRATSTGNSTFTITVTPSGGSTATPTTISMPDSTTTLKVGMYAAVDRTFSQGGYVNGINSFGQPALKLIETSTPGADFVGPIRLGANTEPVVAGFAWREYEQGSEVAYPGYGNITAYGEAAIAIASIGSPVYVRHTVDGSGDFLTGMTTDAAGAAAGATANLWTGTPTPANDTWYQVTITFGAVIETLKYLSDVAATDVEINDGLRADLLTYPSLAEIVGTGTTTLILTGPADGRAFTPVDLGPGVMALVETTAAVSTHTLHPSDKIAAASKRIGSVPVTVPHANA